MNLTRIQRDQLLSPLAYERARGVGPYVLFGMVSALLASELLGVALPMPVLAWNLIVIPAFTAMLFGLWSGRIAPRHGHHVLFVVWITPTVGTLLSIVFTGDPLLTYLLTTELACGALLLQSRTVITTFVLVDIVWGIAIRNYDHAPLFAVIVFASEVVGGVFQRVLCAQIVAAERHRRLQEETATQLADQLDELRRSEQEREKLQQQLVHAQRMEAVGTLSAGLAHDMNNILGSIVSFAELARDEAGVPRGVRDDLERIAGQAKRGAELTRGLLAFSRRGQYRKQVFSMSSIAEEIMTMLARTLPKSIQIRSDLALTPAYLEGDPAQLGQVIVNLATNAVDAMSGSGVIDISTVIDGDHVCVAVTDTGAGMDEATRLRAFEPFFTTKALGKGTGLGLATVWGIVTGHHGTIDVRSKVGVGTTFLITLPLTTARPPAPAPVVIEAAAPLQKPNVLVVDDEPLVRAGTRRILERAGYVVHEASNGAEALDVFSARDISLVVLDMSMPVMGGPECFAKLRERSTVPVLVTTGHTSDADAQEMVARGAAFLEKPFASADLAREALRLLSAA